MSGTRSAGPLSRMRRAACVSPEPPLDVRADVAILLAMRGLDGPINDDWNAWERGYRSALDELLAQGRLAAAAPSGEPRRATAKGTAIDVDEWDRPLYVFTETTGHA